jgi:flagellar biogenesis protein FliO
VSEEPRGEERPSGEEPEDRQHRVFVNLAAAAFLLALAIAVIWVVMSLDARRKLENCLTSGRRNCEEMMRSGG